MCRLMVINALAARPNQLDTHAQAHKYIHIVEQIHTLSRYLIQSRVSTAFLGFNFLLSFISLLSHEPPYLPIHVPVFNHI